jgi:hypothetical protein
MDIQYNGLPSTSVNQLDTTESLPRRLAALAASYGALQALTVFLFCTQRPFSGRKCSASFSIKHRWLWDSSGSGAALSQGPGARS